MRRVVDKEELRVSWQLTNWAEKFIFIVGCIFGSLFMLGLFIGFIEEVSSF